MTVIQNGVLDEKTAKKDPQPGIQETLVDHKRINDAELRDGCQLQRTLRKSTQKAQYPAGWDQLPLCTSA